MRIPSLSSVARPPVRRTSRSRRRAAGLLLALAVVCSCAPAALAANSAKTAKTVKAKKPAPITKPKAPPADVPFSLALVPFAVPGFPGLHSFAFGGPAETLVVAAGRTNGLHGFVANRQAPSFPPQNANDTIYVVDLPHRKLLGQAKVTGLPAPYPSLLSSSNSQYLFDGTFLYVVGGYGANPSSQVPVSLPYALAVDFDALVKAVTSGGPLDAAFAQSHMASFAHPAFAITGGDLKALGDQVLLVYGHRFDGEYTTAGGQQTFQEYSNSVRVFTLKATRGTGNVSLAVSYLGSVPESTALDPDNPFHRRDLNVSAVMSPTGQARLGVFGGVFKGGRIEGYVNPIYIAPGSTLGLSVTPDTTAVQLLSQYDCADLELFSAARGAMFTTLLGGLSQYYWDPSCSCLRRDKVDLNDPAQPVDSLPFIASLSTFRVDATGSSQFLHTGATFPPAGGAPTCPAATGSGTVTANFLGSESKFVPASGLPLYPNGVIHLDALKTKTILGYVFGGIAAYCQPGGDNSLRCYASGAPPATSCASPQIYEVTLDPTTPTPTVRLAAPAA